MGGNTYYVDEEFIFIFCFYYYEISEKCYTNIRKFRLPALYLISILLPDFFIGFARQAITLLLPDFNRPVIQLQLPDYSIFHLPDLLTVTLIHGYKDIQ